MRRAARTSPVRRSEDDVIASNSPAWRAITKSQIPHCGREASHCELCWTSWRGVAGGRSQSACLLLSSGSCRGAPPRSRSRPRRQRRGSRACTQGSSTSTQESSAHRVAASPPRPARRVVGAVVCLPRRQVWLPRTRRHQPTGIWCCPYSGKGCASCRYAWGDSPCPPPLSLATQARSHPARVPGFGEQPTA